MSGANVLLLQRTAGNRAVTRVVQRAGGPLDDTLSSLALATTFNPDPGSGGDASSLLGSPTGPAAASPPAEAAPVGGVTAGTVPPGAGVGGVTAGTVPPGSAPAGAAQAPAGGPAGGQSAELAKTRPQYTGQGAPVSDSAVVDYFRVNPGAVLRSPSAAFHEQMWNFEKEPGRRSEPPRAFAVANQILVAPDFPGPATRMPAHAGDETTGLGTPQAVPQTPLDFSAPRPERPFTRAVFPGFVPGPEPAGRQVAEEASHEEVVAALAADPRTVVRSPNPAWHAQGYALDRGKGQAPAAYKVGGVIIVAPDYPSDGLPAAPVSSPVAPAGPAGAQGPGAAAAAPGGTAAAGAPTAATVPGSASAASGGPDAGEHRWKTDVKATKEGPGVEVEVEGEDASAADAAPGHKTGKAGTLAIGGGDILAAGGARVTSDTVGDVTTTVKTGGNVKVGDGSFALGGSRTSESTKGVDESGAPIKTGGTSATANVEFGAEGYGASGAVSQTTEGGDKHSATGSLTVDAEGNVSGSAGYAYQTKGGTSFKPTVSGGTKAEASDPIPMPGGGFDVTYTVTDTAGGSLSVGKEMSGGPSFTVGGGETSGTIQSGRRHFVSRDQAVAFRDNAATVLLKEHLQAVPPPDTIEGALAIPIGEERGTGTVEGSSLSGSVAFEGASLGHQRTSSTTHTVTVRRVGPKTVEVTGLVSGTKGSDTSASGILTDTVGSSNTASFSVTMEFNLKSDAGQRGFEWFTRTGMPPLSGGKLVSMTKSGSDEDHDNVSIPLLGTAKWNGRTWEVVTEDAKGTHEQFGGEQSHVQDPSWTGRHILGQHKESQSAGITTSIESPKGGKEQESFRAEIKAGGESGDDTRDYLDKAFIDAGAGGDAKPSGEWTISAQISPAVVRDLERNNTELRAAKTKEDRARIYSRLVKERGIAMVRAQVGLGGDATPWDVELKGDKNFPGEAGRAALEKLRSELKARLKGHPAGARSIVEEAQRTLDELAARRNAVADHTRYTDLSDELRDEQLKLIDKHISDFGFIRHMASEEAIKLAPGEKLSSVRERMSAKDGYRDEQHSAQGAEMAKLRDEIASKDGAIKGIDPKILEAITAVQQAQGHWAELPMGYVNFALEHRADYNLHWNIAVGINDRQWAMSPQADALRMKLLEYQSPADRKATAEALLKLLTDRLSLLETLRSEVTSAAESLKPITSPRGMAGHTAFWAGVKGDPSPGEGGE